MNGFHDVDVDGDGRADHITARFTGGAHCCYVLTVQLSATSANVALPFRLDGGYVFGLDLSQPDRFNIADYDGDGVADLCAEIETYNGEPSPLPDEWIAKYGVRMNRIVMTFTHGPRFRDYPGSSCAI